MLCKWTYLAVPFARSFYLLLTRTIHKRIPHSIKANIRSRILIGPKCELPPSKPNAARSWISNFALLALLDCSDFE